MKTFLSRLLCGCLGASLLGVSLANASEQSTEVTAEPAGATVAQSMAQFAEKVKRVVQAIEVYRSPVSPQLSEEDREKSCRELEYELASLQPMTYSYQPDFYNDPVQGTAFWVGTTVFFPAYAALGYTSYYGYRENERIYKTQDRIEALRRLKAEMRCFEG